MNSADELAAIRESHRRLRIAAQAVVDAAAYDVDGRVYRSQLKTLERELAAVPQPTNRLCWMSPT